MQLIDVHSFDHDTHEILYNLLQQRAPYQSISHKEMPSWSEHCAFVDSQPYKHWYLIKIMGEVIGTAYLTNQNEIGIFILEEFRRYGYGREAVKMLMDRHPGRLLANISPSNGASAKMFEGLGFRHIQDTYAYG